MQNDLFDKIIIKKPQKNAFSLSNIHNFTCDFGQLIPAAIREVLPGDSFLLSNEAFVRMAPLKHPILGRINVDFRWFFVPNRLIWTKWEDFITGGIAGNDNSVKPYYAFSGNGFTDSTFGKGTLADFLHMKMPNATINGYEILDMLPFRAYSKIWNDWYRDELLDNEIVLNESVSGSDNNHPYVSLKYRRFHKDYFTSARPTALLGNPVTLPVQKNITGDQIFLSSKGEDNNNHILKVYSSDGYQPFSIGWATGYTGKLSSQSDYLRFPVTELNAGTVQQLRTAFKMQEWQEKSVRGGNRYIESMLVHFGVKSSDARLQRSQYIGGTSSPVVISDIAQTQRSETGETPLGELAGKGTAVINGKPLHFISEEHGFLFCLASIMPEVSYDQGIHRMYLRDDKFDYAWPEFAHIGEQAVLPDELYAGAGRDESNPFGYQSRYAEYKSYPNINSGEFRDTLSSWVLSRSFANAPSLNSQFIGIENSLTNLNNIFATPNVSGHFLVECLNSIKVLRPLSKYSEPGLL